MKSYFACGVLHTLVIFLKVCYRIPIPADVQGYQTDTNSRPCDWQLLQCAFTTSPVLHYSPGKKSTLSSMCLVTTDEVRNIRTSPHFKRYCFCFAGLEYRQAWPINDLDYPMSTQGLAGYAIAMRSTLVWKDKLINSKLFTTLHTFVHFWTGQHYHI